jgi:hypothetical protein
MMPNEYTSARMWSTSCDSLSTSGAVQCTVPSLWLSDAAPPPPATSVLNLVSPKSLTCTGEVCKTLSGASVGVGRRCLDVPLGVEEEVERLEVAVHDARRVKEVHALGRLERHFDLELEGDLRDQLIVQQLGKRDGGIWSSCLVCGSHCEGGRRSKAGFLRRRGSPGP